MEDGRMMDEIPQPPVDAGEDVNVEDVNAFPPPQPVPTMTQQNVVRGPDGTIFCIGHIIQPNGSISVVMPVDEMKAWAESWMNLAITAKKEERRSLVTPDKKRLLRPL